MFLLHCLVQVCQLTFEKLPPNPLDYDYGPRAIALGNLNNDTYLDVVVTNTIIDNIVVCIGQGNGNVLKQSEYSTGSHSDTWMAVIAHLNNDFRMDIIVANFGSNNIGMFLGYGNTTFVEQVNISTGASRPIAIVVIDFNNDTVLDIASANYGTDSISIFYGLGDGSFSNLIAYSTVYDSSPFGLVAGHFNNDNYLDIAVANSGTNYGRIISTTFTFIG